jgi:hypothetical protein
MTPEAKKFLDACSTPYVMKILDVYRGIFHAIDYYGAPPFGSPTYDEVAGTLEYKGHFFTRKDLKEYLAIRPHVMNKKESRESRIARKKSGQKRK